LLRGIRRTLAVTLLAALAASAQAESNLPAIGSPVDQVLSPRQEAAIGADMMARARAQLFLNSDPEVASYIDSVGQGLASGVDTPPFERFTFFVVDDSRINAFALPGGYIGINSGMFLRAESEAEVAGVLAHEIAHVTQRHIARAYAEQQRTQYTTLAAILAGLILGGQNPQAAQAAITTGIASGKQQELNYTRSNEYEADRIGIGILADAGYDPQGMAAMFDLLMRSAGESADAVPEFLRTHPLSTNRIAEAQNRAAQMHVMDARSDTLTFHLMRTRLEVLQADEPQSLHQRWTDSDMPTERYRAAARRYGLALLEIARGDAARAAERLEALRSGAPDNLHYGLALARAYRALGRDQDALATWQHLRSIYPSTYPVIAAGAELLEHTGQADQAVDLVTGYLRDDPGAPAEGWHQLARVAESAGRDALSHEALGEFYTRTNRFDRALKQLQIARDQAESGSPADLRLQARIDQVRSMQRDRMERNPVSSQ